MQSAMHCYFVFTSLYILVSVCLSNSGAKALSNLWTENQLPFYITDIACNGTEDGIFSCPQSNELPVCESPFNDASVMCLCKWFLPRSCIQCMKLPGNNGFASMTTMSSLHECTVEVDWTCVPGWRFHIKLILHHTNWKHLLCQFLGLLLSHSMAASNQIFCGHDAT